MPRQRRHFRCIVVLDFEYEITDGGLPNVLCLVAYVLDENLRHVETVRRWRGEFGASPPFPIDEDTLLVGYSLWAELTCFLTLWWRFPIHVYDLHTAHLSASNVLLPYNPDETRTKQRKRLSDACKAYRIDGWEHIDKPEKPRQSARVDGVSTDSRGCSSIARRMFATRPNCCGGSSRVTSVSHP